MMWKTTRDGQTGTARAAIAGFTYGFGLRRDYKQESTAGIDTNILYFQLVGKRINTIYYKYNHE